MAYHSIHTREQPGYPEGGAGLAESAKQEATGIIEQARDQAQDFAEAVADKAEDLWDGTKHGVRQASAAVAEKAEGAYLSATGFMSRYPLATFFTGCCVGVLLLLACPAYHFAGRDAKR